MRIKVNKNCCEPSAEWEQFKKENADQIEYIRNDAKVRTIGGVCFECGTELYGEWYLRKVSSIKYKEHYVSFYNSQETISPAVKARGEQLVEQLKREDAQAEKERDTFMSSGAVCPVCGHFAKLGGSTVINETPDDALWDYYRVLRDRTNFQSGAKIKDICAQYDIAVSPSREMMEKINKADTESLKSYLFHLIQLETHILSLRKNLRNLYTEQVFNQIDVNRINYAPAIRAKEEKKGDRARYDAAQKEHARLVENVKKLRDTKPEPVDIPELAEPLKPEPQKPGLFNKKKILAQNAEAERNYQKDLLEYHLLCQKRLEEIKQIERLRKEEHRAAIAEAEQEVEASRRELETLRAAAENYTIKKPAEACPEKAKQQMINNEIEQAEGLLKRIYQTRNQLYSANIVFGKYRDLVALATFYEYLMAGRCAELEGRDGAYNLYESEIRANLIISKLTDIEKSLKKIEQSQYMICSQLSEMNRTLDRINDTMGAAYTAIMDIRTNSKDMKEYMAHIAQNTKVMAHNTAVTAYYSKINAELTNALGFMVALK